MNIEQTLKDFFGLETFREGQREVIESIISGDDTLVFMPTGGGKSLTYQLPGVVLEGVTIVISPLISLMKDQVDSLSELGIKARLINSTISPTEIDEILTDLQSGSGNPIKFLYIAPERLNSPKFMQVVKSLKISLLAIDEAHCISQWGHDFRPSYMKILSFIETLCAGEERTFPIVGLTATATKKVREDIKERLGFDKFNTFITGFDRKNITIVVREISKTSEKIGKIEEILKKIKGSGIIYCSSRKSVKEVYNELHSKGASVGMYTGEMTPENREHMQNSFMSGDMRLIVATNAFGMGIDKKDIRFVIHYNLPGSIENYYQEVGRAGRDGEKSFGIVLASYGDTKIQEFFIENTYPEKKEVLDFYDYLFKGYKTGEGKGEQVLKTYYTMANESGIGNDMKVGAIIKILEKYGVIQRGYQGSGDGEFRGRGITLIQEKRAHNNLLVDWNRQQNLKNEAYFKLEEIKKLLFFPHCRKRYILEYFGDTEDLETLGDNCKACDYCLEGKKVPEGDMKKLLPISAYALTLELIKKYDEKFGVQLFVKMLSGSQEKRIIEWNLDRSEFYGALTEYSLDTISAIIECLIYEGYLFKQTGKYPLLGITELGEAVIYRDKQLKENLENLNSMLAARVGVNIGKSKTSKVGIKKSGRGNGTGGAQTYEETLQLFVTGMSIKDIVKQRELTVNTVETHIVKLYNDGKISIIQLLKLTEMKKLLEVKEILLEKFPNGAEKLKPVKDELEALEKKHIHYFDIKIAIAMLEKKDI